MSPQFTSYDPSPPSQVRHTPAAAAPGPRRPGAGEARLIDPRAHRFGAALSVLFLAVAFVLGAPFLVAAITLALGVSAAFGTRYSLLGRPWPLARRLLRVARRA